MKYYLVDNFTDNIIDSVELGSDIGISGARTFFIGRKLMKDDEKSFDNIWRVVSIFIIVGIFDYTVSSNYNSIASGLNFTYFNVLYFALK